MDIKKALKDLSEKMTDIEVGKKIGAAGSMVCRLRSGRVKTTNFERGMKIRTLYKSVFKRLPE